MDSIYYRILKENKGILTVVEMQSFDEYDYDCDKFLRDPEGKAFRFDSKESAMNYIDYITWLK